ncbi:MAG: hypothetical protein J0J04_08305 [Microbacterium sp.]|uniref:hypothetical protein n=1 Tax=Microbacterium sp. TaxID=51671 RepID=UPI001ACCC7F9|nr:hypothetical protein [Microbacterium sp.]MBN9214803.1 hypothetical protein [Microbacterium sp.]
MSRGRGKARGDVHWHIDGRKTPIAYSTQATSLHLGVLAADGHTFASAREHVPFDPEGQAVLDAYIERGLGDRGMADYGVRTYP